MSENFCLNEHALPRASIFIHALTRADSFSCVDTHHDVMGDVTTHYGLIRLPRPTMFDLFILTRSKPPKKKKKKKERKGFDQVKLWILTKSQNFQTDLSHSVFQVHFDFGICFFVQDSEIVQTVQFPESWLLHKSWPKVKIFKKDLSRTIFHVDSDFGVYFFIQESKIAQIVWFYNCWL